MDAIEPLTGQLMAARRDHQLRFMASVIHDLTVAARGFYDQSDRDIRTMRINEAIHRISGHLRDLTNPLEPMTLNRAGGVVANAKVLPPSVISRILEHSPL
jgi:hypothetical protein